MKPTLITRRAIELVALMLIGEGIMGLLKPRGYSRLWRLGPALLRSTMEDLAEHPNIARSIYAVEAAIGIALASFQTGEAE